MNAIEFILAGMLAAATPFLLAALGELVVERAGVLNLGVEGLMALGAVLAFIVARFLGKGLALLAFGRLSGVRPGSAGLLTLALLPMSGLAVVMVLDTQAMYPAFGGELAAVVLSAVAILEILGPVATQFALRRAGEADPAAGGA